MVVSLMESPSKIRWQTQLLGASSLCVPDSESSKKTCILFSLFSNVLNQVVRTREGTTLRGAIIQLNCMLLIQHDGLHSTSF